MVVRRGGRAVAGPARSCLTGAANAVNGGVDAGSAADGANAADAANGARAANAAPHATLKDLRKSTRHTQEDLAAALGVGQDTISRLEHRSDMLLSTLRHYIESVGGQLDLVATFPGQPPVIIDPLGDGKRKEAKRRRRALRALGSP